MLGVVVPTTIGALGAGFTPRGLARVLLPEVDDPDGARMKRTLEKNGFEVRPPVTSETSASQARWIARLTAHLRGEDVAFDDLPLDLDGVSLFARRVYKAARRIPPGTTATYAQLAAALESRSARPIGVALGRNPIAIVIPCHRVVGAADAGGFSAPGGNSTKATLLAIEGGALDDPEHRLARRHLARVDPRLAPWVRRLPCTLPIKPTRSLFRVLVRAIAGQQLSTRAAATIFGRLEAAIGDAAWGDGAPAAILALPPERVRATGMSGAKTEAVRDLARKVVDGSLDLAHLTRVPDHGVIAELTRVRGIGRWTAEMLLVFELGRPDVLPVADLGIRKGAQRVWGLRALPTAETIVRRAEAWRPWRSIGSWYLWRALDAGAG